MRRVDEAIKAVVSETIPTLKDPRIGFVTVTGVVTTSDLAQATVWLSVYGGEKQQRATLAALDSAAGILQSRVNRELHLRRTPQLVFQYDQSVEHGVRMTKLIDELDPGPAEPEETSDDTETDMAAVVGALAAGDRFLVTSHENPDGDALGSLLAMHLALQQLGKDSVMVLVGGSPLPGEYAFLDLDGHGLLRELPGDAGARVLVAVDCAQETRLTDDRLLEAGMVVNVDHHHDNTRFGTVNLVDDEASSTAEVLADVFAGLGVAPDPPIAEALYAGLVTDTGRFQYTNTTPKALRLAADLLEAGRGLHASSRGLRVDAVREGEAAGARPRPGASSTRRAGSSSPISSATTSEVGAVEPYSEGIIDVLRAVEGAELAALIREPPRGDGHVAQDLAALLDDRVDVSAIARQSAAEGIAQAAGFSSDLSIEEITAFIVARSPPPGTPRTGLRWRSRRASSRPA